MRQHSRKRGDEAAIIFESRIVTWKELQERVEAASRALLQRLDGSSQSVVAILAPNSPEFVITYLAVVQAGHIAMPLDVSFKKLEIDSVLNSVRPRVVLAMKNLSHLVDGESWLIDDLLAAETEPAHRAGQKSPDEQIATLFLSSGTTGSPKAVPNTHANILWDIKAIAKPMGWSAKDSVLITLHLAHRHGLAICLLGALYHGNTVYLEGRFSPRRTLELLESGNISLYSAVPSIYESLVEFEPKRSFDLSAVRLFASSSSPLPPYLRQAFERRYGRRILDRYGTSETGSIAIRHPDEPEAFGDLLDGVKIRLEAGGEVALKSPGLFPGYYQNPASTRQHMTTDGWWLTGDIGKMQAGRLVLKGRSQQRLTKSGYSIYPQDIEWALSQNPKAGEVSVLGLHPSQGVDDTVVAFYTGAAASRSLQAYSKANLPRSWRPDLFIRLTELPKTRSGKVQLKKLTEIAQAHHV